MDKVLKFNLKYLRFLTTSPEVKKILSSDSVLADLERMREKQDVEKTETVTVIGDYKRCFYSVGFSVLHPVSPAVLSILWLIDSPFLYGSKVTAVDVDIALWLLSNAQDLYAKNQDIPFTKEKLKDVSFGFCPLNGIEYQDGKDAVEENLLIGFRANLMFPFDPVNQTAKIQKYDADWLTGVVSMVHQETGLNPDEIKWNLSYCECGYYMAQYCRHNGKPNIEKRLNEETANQIFERTNYLCREYLESIGIKEEEYSA